jgi:hypothetical protein
MTIEQTVEIPANHRLTIEVPPEIPAGKAILVFTSAGEEKKPTPEYSTTEKEAEQRPTPLTDKISGLLSHIGDISPEEIRAERLSKYLK